MKIHSPKHLTRTRDFVTTISSQRDRMIKEDDGFRNRFDRVHSRMETCAVLTTPFEQLSTDITSDDIAKIQGIRPLVSQSVIERIFNFCNQFSKVWNKSAPNGNRDRGSFFGDDWPVRQYYPEKESVSQFKSFFDLTQGLKHGPTQPFVSVVSHVLTHLTLKFPEELHMILETSLREETTYGFSSAIPVPIRRSWVFATNLTDTKRLKEVHSTSMIGFECPKSVEERYVIFTCYMSGTDGSYREFNDMKRSPEGTDIIVRVELSRRLLKFIRNENDINIPIYGYSVRIRTNYVISEKEWRVQQPSLQIVANQVLNILGIIGQDDKSKKTRSGGRREDVMRNDMNKSDQNILFNNEKHIIPHASDQLSIERLVEEYKKFVYIGADFEARLGHWKDGRVEAGVSSEQFNFALRSLLHACGKPTDDGGKATHKYWVIQTEFWWNNTIRGSVPTSGERKLQCCLIERLGNHDLKVCSRAVDTMSQAFGVRFATKKEIRQVSREKHPLNLGVPDSTHVKNTIVFLWDGEKFKIDEPFGFATDRHSHPVENKGEKPQEEKQQEDNDFFSSEEKRFQPLLKICLFTRMQGKTREMAMRQDDPIHEIECEICPLFCKIPGITNQIIITTISIVLGRLIGAAFTLQSMRFRRDDISQLIEF